MQKYKQFLITGLVLFSLFLTNSLAVGQIYNGNTTIINTNNFNGNVTGNKGLANIASDVDMPGEINIPGLTSSDAVFNNHVIVGGASSTITVNGFIYGGFTHGTGDVYKSDVIINDAIVNSGTNNNLVGGYSVKGNATDNRVIVNGAVGGSIYGGMGQGRVANNEVEINGTANNVTGGWSNGTETLTANIVKINGTTNGSVYGGSAGGNSNVTYNTVEINGTANGLVVGGYSYRYNENGDVTHNTVIIGGKANTSIYGGYSHGLGTVTDNKVEVNGTVTGDVYGGIINRQNNDKAVSDNSIKTINGSTVNGLIGGYTTGNGAVTGNMIEVGGTVTSYVFSGYTTGSGTVQGNTVTILNTANLTSAGVYGFNSSAIGMGNILNVTGFHGDVDDIGNFDTYNFVLGQLSSTLEFINISGIDSVTLLNNYVDIDRTNINISFTQVFLNNNINVGDVITVISHINAGANPASVTVLPSPFFTYDYIETHDTGQLLLTLTGLTVNSETSFVGEGFAAGLAFLGQGADLRSDLYFAPQGLRFIPFAKMVYGKQYISTGSSVNVKGFSAIAGLALNTNFDNGSQLVVGAFVEGGRGDYDSRNNFSNSARVKGSGDTEYYGGGLLARYAMASGLYGEGTFAVGKAETDFRTRDFTSSTTSKYDYSVPYYSAHLTVGQVLSLNHMLDLDVYGKYLWTRQTGDNVTVDGYRFKFKDADSHRVRVGGKLKADVSPQLEPYVGAAYEYEFSGKIKGSLYSMNLDEPSMRGSTGIGELGLVWMPNDAENLRVDLGAQGYVGKREGVSGGLTVSLSF